MSFKDSKYLEQPGKVNVPLVLHIGSLQEF